MYCQFTGHRSPVTIKRLNNSQFKVIVKIMVKVMVKIKVMVKVMVNF